MNVDVPVRISLHFQLRQDRLAKRRDGGVLRLVPDDAHDDRTLHRPIHPARTCEEVHESLVRLLALSHIVAGGVAAVHQSFKKNTYC